ncbi:MAG: hypothetical protein IGS50_10335 [Synechococcales cyanobacterium C42_A2020_086]|jgi:hypothetical protein|nr:hypothetical protein [Synechococcales cyanobacterium C42_A2020_086]
MPTGFGKTQAPLKVSKRSTERAQAAKQYEQMKSEGLPDYEIYLRIHGKKNWYPVGVIAVKRSSQINQAIFGSQTELLQGAFRLYPVLRKHQQHLEFGYRLKEYKDEPIQVATLPQPAVASPVGGVIRQVQQQLKALLKRG